jgi:hypothetical protein
MATRHMQLRHIDDESERERLGSLDQAKPCGRMGASADQKSSDRNKLVTVYSNLKAWKLMHPLLQWFIGKRSSIIFKEVHLSA